jgi:hypothetical protein
LCGAYSTRPVGPTLVALLDRLNVMMSENAFDTSVISDLYSVRLSREVQVQRLTGVLSATDGG